MKRITFLAFTISVVLSLSFIAFVGCGDDDQVEPVPVDTTVASLVSKTWSLASYGTPGSETGVLGGTSISATFGAGTVGGSSGCNTYSASYNADDTGNLSVGSITATLMLCIPPERMAQENAFKTAMNNATAFLIDNGVLEVMYGSGQHLIFE